MPRDRKSYLQDLERELFDLTAKINWLLDTHNLRSPEGTYTFPDGDTWDNTWITEMDNGGKPWIVPNRQR